MTRPALSNVKTVGGMLPSEVLERIATGDTTIPGLTPADYGLAPHETLRDAANRAWSRLTGLWHGFQTLRAQSPSGHISAGDTRQRWLLPLFSELGYGRLPRAERVDVTLDGHHYAISHRWQATPIHLLGTESDLDTRHKGVAGAASASPHGLLQDFLNRKEPDLWGFLSNGLTLRVLRDHESLSRQAYVEFDLEAILDDDRFSDFFLLWLLCHESRVRPHADAAALDAAADTDDTADDDDSEVAAAPSAATTDTRPWLERWVALARDEGIRALDQLRDGVQQAIEALGRGFLTHRDNAALRARLRAEPGTPPLDKQDYYRQLLRLAYRLIFLFAAEDRDLLLDPKAPPEARERYVTWYGTRPLRDRALRRRGGPHPDLWQRLRLVMGKLDQGCPELALPALGSYLWSADACPDLMSAECDNASLHIALRNLGEVQDKKGNRYPVSWRNIGADELGSVYESLLELHPDLDPEGGERAFRLVTAGGHDRKTSGSYYTPDSLVQCLLDSALNPVLGEAARKPDAEAAILALKVCDPACGSGHFLVAAGHRMAHRLARVRSGDVEPSPEHVRHALRDVVGRCLFGVDINPMAVELCKVSLWLEAIEPGRPLSFLDAHIQCGNSLLGATPALLARGIPDAAFAVLEGDDKKIVSGLKKRNKQEQAGQLDLLGDAPPAVYDPLSAQIARVEAIGDGDASEVHKKERAWQSLQASQTATHAKLLADAWCAAFVWPKDHTEVGALALTESSFQRLRYGLGPERRLQETIDKLAAEYQFFHWHVAFPQVFGEAGESFEDDDTTGWTGGFDVVLGNPPWEQVELKEQEFFAGVRPDIASAGTAVARKRAIAKLEAEDPALHCAYLSAFRRVGAENHLLRTTGRFPLCARGRINTYSVFAELNRALITSHGRLGCIVPSGIATDANTQDYFAALVTQQTLVSLWHFENEDRVFPGVHHAFRFCLLVIAGAADRQPAATFVAYARAVAHVSDPTRRYVLERDDFERMNPNTRTLPLFRRAAEADITRRIHRHAPVLITEGQAEENPWGVAFRQGIVNMASDSALFAQGDALAAAGWRLESNRFTRGAETMLPLYEAKMVHHFDHRFGTYLAQTEAQARQGKLPETTDAGHADPWLVSQPRYWVAESEVEARLEGRWAHGWLLGWRDICRATDSRTVIASVIPRVATGDTFLLAFPDSPLALCLYAGWTSFVFDFVARQKVGGTHLKYHVFRQLPNPTPAQFSRPLPWGGEEPIHAWILPRVLELTYTAWDLEAFGRDCGHAGPPFRWDEARRLLLRCELDAAFFHLYGVSRDDTAYIMDTFPIVRRKDEKAHGEYRTKRVILETYDAMQAAMTTGRPYQTLLTPPPAHPSLCHPPRLS